MSNRRKKNTGLKVRKPGRWVGAFMLFLLLPMVAAAQAPVHPLAPPDRSSPRAALKTFLHTGDQLGIHLANEYVLSPTRSEYSRVAELSTEITRSLDLSQIPDATHNKAGRAAALALYETLSRIPLPPWEAIPDAYPTNWVIPNTEIVLIRTPDETQASEFLFSPETVARAGEFYARTKDAIYIRPIPFPQMHEVVVHGGGWMIPYSWTRSFPAWLNISLLGQALWKWIGFVISLGLFGILLRLAFRFSRSGTNEHPLRQALSRLVLPAFFLIAMPPWAYVNLVQLNLRGGVGIYIEFANTAVMYAAGVWMIWRLASVVAEAIVALPSIAPQSIDAHLIRICTRLLGLLGGAVLFALGAEQLGMHLYGIIAGLGVGGLALALAAQPSIENLIGGMSLFADKPIRVGDYCQCEGVKGYVETIGIRSTRIRGRDQTVRAIPNALLAKMSITNLSQRDRIPIQTVVRVRYETTVEQLRYLLVKIRELLRDHPRIADEKVRVRLMDLGTSSLDIELFAYATTGDRQKFRAIREDVLLHIMEIVLESGTGFAFPSQTMYFARDVGVDAERTETAEAQVRDWREKGSLPFPDEALAGHEEGRAEA